MPPTGILISAFSFLDFSFSQGHWDLLVGNGSSRSKAESRKYCAFEPVRRQASGISGRRNAHLPTSSEGRKTLNGEILKS